MNEVQIEPPKIGSVEEFQGQERMVIIISAVRSRLDTMSSNRRADLGFLSDPRRVCVALTRARALLIILGNPHVLCNDPQWRSVLIYCLRNKSYFGCDIPQNIERIVNNATE